MIVVLGSVGMGMRAWMSRYKEKRAETGRAQAKNRAAKSCGEYRELSQRSRISKDSKREDRNSNGIQNIDKTAVTRDASKNSENRVLGRRTKK